LRLAARPREHRDPSAEIEFLDEVGPYTLQLDHGQPVASGLLGKVTLTHVARPRVLATQDERADAAPLLEDLAAHGGGALQIALDLCLDRRRFRLRLGLTRCQSTPSACWSRALASASSSRSRLTAVS